MLAVLFSLLFSISVSACDFSAETKAVYSLSGPVTLHLKDLGLLKNPKLKAVSVFHPVSRSEFSGEFFPGGVFLSHQAIQKLKGSTVFFDESRELARIFARYPEIKAVEVKTRNQNPLEVVNSIETLVAPHLTHCNSQAKLKMQNELNELKGLIKNKPYILFFLGAIQNGRYPEMLMVQDGVVKWMVSEKLITSYPSELAYVNWSSQILNSLPKNVYKVGLKDSGNGMTKDFQKSDFVVNLTYPGSLIPGFGQVEAMLYLFKSTTF